MRYSFLFITAALLITGCSRNELDVDISNITIEPLMVHRLEKDLHELTEQNFETKSREIKNNYGDYYEHYVMNFLNRKGSTDSLYEPAVLSFVSDNDIRGAYTDIQALYPDSKINAIAAEADNCVKRFHYHFPKRKLPARFITCMSGWNYAIQYTDNALVVSLDMYLGDTSRFYQMLHLPQYQAKNMNERYIVSDIAKGWMLTEFDNTDPVNVLLNHTIFWGKLFYAINALLPSETDSIMIGYTTKQINYCTTYEKNIWGYFAEKNRLYENNMQTVRELTSDGPFTGAISKECPPRIAMWVGWQIVRSYMKNNKEVTLEQLMEEKDPAKILNKSKYRP